MKRVYQLVALLLGGLLVYNPINSLLAVTAHRGLPHSLYFAIVALLLAAWYRWAQDGLGAFAKAPAPVVAATALMLWCGVNLTYGLASHGEAIRGLNVDFGGILLFLTVWLIRPGKVASRRLIWTMLAAVAFIILFAIPDFVAPFKFEHWAGYGMMHYVQGNIPQIRSLTPGPNTLGTLMTVAAVLAAMLIPNIWAMSAFMILIGLTMGLTYGRSAWIGAAIAGGGFIVYSWLKSRRVVIWPVVLGVAIIAGASLGAMRYHAPIIRVNKHGKSNAEHQAAAVAAARNTLQESAFEKIFGYGLGMAGPIVLTSPSTLQIIAHHPDLDPITESWYLQLMQEIGLIGLLVYLWLYLVTVKDLFRKNVLVALLAIGLAFNALTLEIWAADANLNLIFWTLAGLVLYSQQAKAESPKAKP